MHLASTAALRNAPLARAPRRSKSASRKIFSRRGRAARRKPAYALEASRENWRRYDEARQDRQSLQTDPVGYEDHLNLYQYAFNDPINGRDPSGRQVVLPGPVPIPLPPPIPWNGPSSEPQSQSSAGPSPLQQERAQARTDAIAQARQQGGATFFHGTDRDSTQAIAMGANLSAEAATQLAHGDPAPVGFYMTPDLHGAQFFAARTGDPGILQIQMSPLAVERLTSPQVGGVIRPMEMGDLRGEPITEFYLPPRAFDTFQALRYQDEIMITPHYPD